MFAWTHCTDGRNNRDVIYVTGRKHCRGLLVVNELAMISLAPRDFRSQGSLQTSHAQLLVLGTTVLYCIRQCTEVLCIPMYCCMYLYRCKTLPLRPCTSRHLDGKTNHQCMTVVSSHHIAFTHASSVLASTFYCYYEPYHVGEKPSIPS